MKTKLIHPPLTFSDSLEIAQERAELVGQDPELKTSVYKFKDGRVAVFHHLQERIFWKTLDNA